MSAQQPEALRLFTHQLLDHDGAPNGVHLGVDDLEICKQSHIDGETSPVIHEWVDVAELRRMHSENERLNLYASGADMLVGAWKARAQDFMTQRDELLMALKELLGPYVAKPCEITGMLDLLVCGEDISAARAAIAKAIG